MQAEELISELRSSQTDLARFVEAVRAWQRREPQAWAKVAGWLEAHHVAVVAV